MNIESEHTMKNTNERHNEKAITAFVSAMVQAEDLLEELRAKVDDSMGLTLDELNWAHVGDANHMVEQLKAILKR